MFSLMHPKQLMGELQSDYLPGSVLQYSIDDSMRTEYGEQLCDLVHQCLAFEPDERPTLQQLEARIAEFIANDDYSRAASEENQDESDTKNLLLWSVEAKNYKLGMLFDPRLRV